MFTRKADPSRIRFPRFQTIKFDIHVSKRAMRRLDWGFEKDFQASHRLPQHFRSGLMVRKLLLFHCNQFPPEFVDLVTNGGRQMNRKMKLALSSAVVGAVAIVGPAYCWNHYATNEPRTAMTAGHAIRNSVVKVHTDHGVITLPGNADSWDAAEHAVFVADSIADLQMANSEVPWRIDNE
jgi:hypothetical protein